MGFDFNKENTFRHFIIGALVCKSLKTQKAFYKTIERTIKNKLAKKGLKKAKNIELKGSSSSLSIKSYFFKHLPEKEWELNFVILDKEKILPKLPKDIKKERLYNFLAGELIKEIKIKEQGVNVTLYMDRLKGNKSAKRFNNYIESQLETNLQIGNISYYHVDSRTNLGVQAIDMFLIGINEKYNSKKEDWYKQFEEKIKKEKVIK